MHTTAGAAAGRHDAARGWLGDRSVARVGYGAMALEHFAEDRAAGAALLRTARDLGVDHVDTADFYGDGVANDVVRRAFGRSEDVVVVTKVGARRVDGDVPLALAQRPDELRQQVQENLRHLDRERLDVVNLRRADVGPGLVAEGDQLVDLDDQLAVLTAMRDEGLIGAIGMSAVTDEVLRRALPAGIVCVQNAYSLVDRHHGVVFDTCRAHGVAWVPYFPLGGAFPGSPKVTEQPVVQEAAAALGVSPAQVGLAWLLQQGGDVLLIPGTTSDVHLRENVASATVDLGEWSTALDAARIGDAASTA